MIKKFNLLLLFISVAFALQAQKPALHPLRSNATLIEYHKNEAKKKHTTQLNNKIQSTPTTTLTLPFYDEFSYAGPFPDSTKWPGIQSQSVFVNHTKAMAPPTLGVATFDGLDRFGYPYSPSITSNYANNLPSASSDTMVSAPIRLDSIPALQIGLSPADSVYLSFYYQGKGFWEKPENTDYLNLELFSPTTDTTGAWTQVWSQGGYLYDPDSSWHLAMIPILDTSYFHKGFQFRFSNLSGACGDVDHWHIDEVYLNHNRTANDTMFSSIVGPGSVFSDVSFVYDLQSPLKNYSQMPYKQYAGASDMKTNIGTFLRCDFSTDVSVKSHYSFYNNLGAQIATSVNGSNNLYPYIDSGYCKDPAIIYPSLNNFVYPVSGSDSSFTMKFYVESADNNLQNDTITFHQKFSNYYAYDDGSAEAGFGIDPGPMGAGNYLMAGRFTLNQGDVLRAMDIFFEPVIDVDAQQISPFNIMVWSDNNGVPGNIIYTDSLRYPYFPADSLINGATTISRENTFLRYQFRDSVPLAAGTTFYLGINQLYNATEITIGFDMNYDFHRNFFYNSDGTDWYVLPGDLDPDYRGSLMIRPVFGDSLQTLAINKIKNAPSANISLYPNPAADYVYIQSNDAISSVVITDLLGNVVLQQTENSIKKINTLSLPSGVYLVKALTNKGFTDTQKLILAK